MKLAYALGVCSLVGCSSSSQEPVARLDLRAAFAAPAVDPVGVAVAPDGARFVFDEARGLFRLDGDQAVEVVAMSSMPDPGPDAPLLLPITDLVAIAPDQFALTAIGDGYVLDTQAMTLAQRFCYVPEGTPANLMQRTDAIAYDATTQRLFAQPNTYDQNGAFLFAQVAAYEGPTGESLRWYDFTGSSPATGMVAYDGALLVGQGARLARFDVDSGELVELDDLARFGVRSIDGLALDAAAGTLVVVDRDTDALFDIDLAQLSQL